MSKIHVAVRTLVDKVLSRLKETRSNSSHGEYPSKERAHQEVGLALQMALLERSKG